MKSANSARLPDSFFTHLGGVLLLLVFLLASPAAFALPGAFKAEYSVKKGGFTLGKLNVSLDFDGSEYRYKKETRSTGMAALLTGIKIDENVKGKVNGQGLEPSSYIFKQSRHTKLREDNTVFSGTTARGRYKENPFTLKLPHGAIDRASLELVLAHDLNAKKSRLVYPVVEKGRIRDYIFKRSGNEKINTSAGTFDTIKVTVDRDSNKRQTIFWMARELSYIPVKIYHREKGDEIITEISHYRFF